MKLYVVNFYFFTLKNSLNLQRIKAQYNKLSIVLIVYFMSHKKTLIIAYILR